MTKMEEIMIQELYAVMDVAEVLKTFGFTEWEIKSITECTVSK